MQLMVEGDKWEMYIPSEMGYGDSGSGAKIGGGDVLVFTMEILKINGNKVPASRCDVSTLEGCDDKEKTYLNAKKALSTADIATEVKRLDGMSGKKMAADKKCAPHLHTPARYSMVEPMRRTRHAGGRAPALTFARACLVRSVAVQAAHAAPQARDEQEGGALSVMRRWPVSDASSMIRCVLRARGTTER